jgi:hypothetical protein
MEINVWPLSKEYPLSGVRQYRIVGRIECRMDPGCKQ